MSESNRSGKLSHLPNPTDINCCQLRDPQNATIGHTTRENAPRARMRTMGENAHYAPMCITCENAYYVQECVSRANGYHGADCIMRMPTTCEVSVSWTVHVTVNHQFGLPPQHSAIITLYVTWSIPTLIQEPTHIYREIHFREPNWFPMSRSRNRSVLSILEYRPNGSTEPIGNPERVGRNRLKHTIYRFGLNRKSVLDRPDPSSAWTQVPLNTGGSLLIN